MKIEHQSDKIPLANVAHVQSRLPCPLCHTQDLPLTTAVIRCGATCGQRIQRGGVFYVSPKPNPEGLAQHWCLKCYNGLSSEFTSLLGGGIKEKKSSLVRKVNDEVNFEKWIECTRCHRSCHQICALYVPQFDIQTTYPVLDGLCWDATHYAPPNELIDLNFVCPLCLVEDDVWQSETPTLSPVKTSSDFASPMALSSLSSSSSSTSHFAASSVTMPPHTPMDSSSSSSSSSTSSSSAMLPPPNPSNASSSEAIFSSGRPRVTSSVGGSAHRPRSASSVHRPRSISSFGGYQKNAYKDVPVQGITRETLENMDEGRGFGAKALPASTMSQAMERRLRTRVFNEARDKGIDRGAASNFLNSITIRCLTGGERDLDRWKRMKQWIEVQSKSYFEEMHEKVVAKKRAKKQRKVEARLKAKEDKRQAVLLKKKLKRLKKEKKERKKARKKKRKLKKLKKKKARLAKKAKKAKKAKAPPAPPVKRGRGRPRKVVVESSSSSSESSSSSSESESSSDDSSEEDSSEEEEEESNNDSDNDDSDDDEEDAPSMFGKDMFEDIPSSKFPHRPMIIFMFQNLDGVSEKEEFSFFTVVVLFSDVHFLPTCFVCCVY